jgi:type IV secretory pathway VirB2 component (pilin)
MTAGTGVRAARGLSGLLAGGLVVLAIVVCAAQWLAGTSGRPGPGVPAVVGHVVAASVAVVLQLVADRLRGPLAALASGSVLMIAAGVLWFGWWS